MKNQFIIILLVIFIFIPKAVNPSTINDATWINQPLAKGVFLIASPFFKGRDFESSVILIAKYSRKGALGVIINRRTSLSLSEVLPDLKGLDKKSDSLFLGGPVAPGLPFMLLQTHAAVNNDVHIVLNNVYYSLDAKTIRTVIANKNSNENLRVYAGYAAWTSGQLDKEVARGFWAVIKADQHTIFDKEPETIWEEMIRRGPQLTI